MENNKISIVQRLVSLLSIQYGLDKIESSIEWYVSTLSQTQVTHMYTELMLVFNSSEIAEKNVEVKIYLYTIEGGKSDIIHVPQAWSFIFNFCIQNSEDSF